MINNKNFYNEFSPYYREMFASKEAWNNAPREQREKAMEELEKYEAKLAGRPPCEIVFTDDKNLLAKYEADKIYVTERLVTENNKNAVAFNSIVHEGDHAKADQERKDVNHSNKETAIMLEECFVAYPDNNLAENKIKNKLNLLEERAYEEAYTKTKNFADNYCKDGNFSEVLDNNKSIQEEALKAAKEKYGPTTFREQINLEIHDEYLNKMIDHYPTFGKDSEIVKAYNQKRESERRRVECTNKARDIVKSTREEVTGELFKEQSDKVKELEKIVEDQRKKLPHKRFNLTEKEKELNNQWDDFKKQLENSKQDLDKTIKENGKLIKERTKQKIQSDPEKYKELMGLSAEIKDASIKQREFVNKMNKNMNDQSFDIAEQRRMSTGGMTH